MQIEQLGPYKISRQLGRGGMGTVYEGTLIETGEPAAIKILSATLTHDEGFRERFKAEIETLRKLRHPNIVRLFGFGEQADQLFYAMELVVGRSLEDELQAGQKFTWNEVTDYAIQTCRALKHAHDRGVIHRDIKPANLLLTPEGQIKLSDFGIAKLFGSSGMTAVGGVLGTAEYMAPEQTDGRPITPRCDLYSLGGVMYTLLAGRPPFKAATLVEMLQLQRFAEPDPVRRYAPDVPEELQVILSDLLIKDPDQRIATAMVLSRRLEAMRHGLSMRIDPLLAERAHARDHGPAHCERIERHDDGAGAQAPVPPAPAPDEEYAVESSADPEASTAAARHERALKATADLVSVTSAKTGRQVLPGSPPLGAAAAVPTEPAAKMPASFVTVSDEEHRRFEASPTEAAHWSVLQTALLARAVAILAAGTWYLMQPASADRMYERISRASAAGDTTAAELDVKAFLAHYPNDPRAAGVQQLATSLEEQRAGRQAEFQARAAYAVDASTLLKRAYLEAMSYAKLNPEIAVQRLTSILALYDGDKQLSPNDQETLESAREQAKLFRNQIERRAKEDVATLLSRLDAAAGLEKTDPAAARAIREAIVKLYSDKPWAAVAVERAAGELAARTAAGNHAGSTTSQ